MISKMCNALIIREVQNWNPNWNLTVLLPLKSTDYKCCEDVEHSCWECKVVKLFWKTICLFWKFKIDLDYHSLISFQDIYSSKINTYIHIMSFIWMSIEIIFAIIKNCKQPNTHHMSKDHLYFSKDI